MPLLFPLSYGGSIGYPIKKSPSYNSIVQQPASGRGVVRIPTMNFPLWKYELDVSYLFGDAQGTFKGQTILGGTTWQQLVNFYMSVQGQASSWYFLDPYDNSVGSYTVTSSAHSGNFQVGEPLIQATTNATANYLSVSGTTYTISGYAQTPNNSSVWTGQITGSTFTPSNYPAIATAMNFATADGTTTAWSITRTILSNGAQDLIQNFVTAPLIYFYYSGTYHLQSSSGYTIDEYGTITFNSAPTSGYIIGWAGAFYMLCAFEEDVWSGLEETMYQYWELKPMKFTSVLL